MHDVLIIGGGVIGLTTAYVLARNGLSVLVVDQGDLGMEASWAGAGIIPPGDPHHAASPFDRLRSIGSVRFAPFSAELRERTGIDNGYRVCGGLEFLNTGVHAAEEEWHGVGIRLQKLDEAQSRQREPSVASGLGPAIHLPDLAQLRNPRHMKALIAACRATGRVVLRPGVQVYALKAMTSRIDGVETSAGLLKAGHYLLAAGAWSRSLLLSLGWDLPVTPVRGQIALVNPGRPIIQHVLMWGAQYMVPRSEGRILVGSTEENVGFDKKTTAAGIQELLALAIKLVPELGQATLEQSWAGLRPGSPDHLPYLGRVPGTDNLLVATGHFRAGIQLSLGTAQVVAELVQGLPLTVPIDAFSIDRVRNRAS